MAHSLLESYADLGIRCRFHFLGGADFALAGEIGDV